MPTRRFWTDVNRYVDRAGAVCAHAPDLLANRIRAAVESQLTDANAGRVRARIVLEAATGAPLSDTERAGIVQPVDERTVVNSGLEETMITAYHAIRDTMHRVDGISDLRTAAFHLALDRVGRAYIDLGVFP